MIFKAKVDFEKNLQKWDGFGFNYVETAQTEDYDKYPQDYGGFSTLSSNQKNEIIDLIFGEDGLKPGVIKMFFDGFHQEISSDDIESFIIEKEKYNHLKTTANMLYFVQNGYEILKQQGKSLKIITTLYGPPAFMTKQKFVRGRDLDKKYIVELAKYMAAWIQYLVETQNLPVEHISIHNEGEDFERWPEDGSENWMSKGHDYNMYWPPELVCEFMPILKKVLSANKLENIKVANGETTNWYRFSHWGYADEISNSKDALESIGLVTSHAFVGMDNGLENRWFSDARSSGIDKIRSKKPEIHAWGTSLSWKNMNVDFLADFYDNIYNAGVNSLIPWAGIQRHDQWTGGDPNPGTAFLVDGQGNYSIEKGYYYYKNLCRAGQPEMNIVQTYANNTQVKVFGFGKADTEEKNSFCVLNTGLDDIDLNIVLNGINGKVKGYRTSIDENYKEIGEFNVDKDLKYVAPSKSITTFFEEK